MSNVEAKGLFRLLHLAGGSDVTPASPALAELRLADLVDFSPNQKHADGIGTFQAKGDVPFKVSSLEDSIRLMFQTHLIRDNIHLLPERNREDTGVSESYQARYAGDRRVGIRGDDGEGEIFK